MLTIHFSKCTGIFNSLTYLVWTGNAQVVKNFLRNIFENDLDVKKAPDYP